jgi:hypothetical protein
MYHDVPARARPRRWFRVHPHGARGRALLGLLGGGPPDVGRRAGAEQVGRTGAGCCAFLCANVCATPSGTAVVDGHADQLPSGRPVRQMLALVRTSGEGADPRNLTYALPAVNLAKRCRVPVREFSDDAGEVWTVWTTFPKSDANVRPQYRRGWLSFQCESLRRRLVPIPDGWEAAGDDQLRTYLRRAHDAKKADGQETRVESPQDADEQPSEAEIERVPSGIARIRRILRGIRIDRIEE